MIDLWIFAIVTIIGLALSAVMFVFRDILHSAIALASVFFINSLFFLLLNQPLLAIVQLFIMVGGIATFLFVGVASASYSKFKHTRALGMFVIWAVLFIALASTTTGTIFTGQQSNSFGAGSIAFSLQYSASIFYIMAILMFGVAIGAIVLLKKTARAGKTDKAGAMK